ncbi:MAG: hypothetical protein J5669_01195 [Bacteroidales bacterium]|nr:hypothetical protein [Bacteroidales bacterium]
MKARYLIMALVPFLALAACQKEEAGPLESLEPGLDAADSVWTLTVQATKSTGTKALWLDNSGTPDVLRAYWKNTDAVQVFHNGSFVGSLGVTPGAGEKPVTATLNGTISVPGLTVGDELLLMLPRQIWDYTGQVGTLASIESTYDYATATVEVSNIVGSTVTTTKQATFQNRQSVYRFSFTTGEALSIKDLTLSAANGSLVQSRAYEAGAWGSVLGNLTVTPASATAAPLFVSILNQSTAADTYSFILTGSDDALYLAHKDIPNTVLDTPGKFISAQNIPATQPDFTPSGTTDTAL